MLCEIGVLFIGAVVILWQSFLNHQLNNRYHSQTLDVLAQLKQHNETLFQRSLALLKDDMTLLPPTTTFTPIPSMSRSDSEEAEIERLRQQN